ncbi:transposable element Tc1 transposase [Trichonephila clavipes]|nr:transposable element Tc1 transposase [Trichonephila clavipes]
MLPAIEKRRSQGTVFSDESRFHLCPDDHRKRVLRYQGQRVDPAFNTGPQAEVMLVKHFLGQPDLSSIEHVWDMMGRRLNLPGNFDDLAQRLEHIWQEISQETTRVLYRSILRRVAACIQARDRSTPY